MSKAVRINLLWFYIAMLNIAMRSSGFALYEYGKVIGFTLLTRLKKLAPHFYPTGINLSFVIGQVVYFGSDCMTLNRKPI